MRDYSLLDVVILLATYEATKFILNIIRKGVVIIFSRPSYYIKKLGEYIEKCDFQLFPKYNIGGAKTIDIWAKDEKIELYLDNKNQIYRIDTLTLSGSDRRYLSKIYDKQIKEQSHLTELKSKSLLNHKVYKLSMVSDEKQQ